MIMILRQGEMVYLLELRRGAVRMWEVAPGQIDVESVVIIEEERDGEVQDGHLEGVQEVDELEPDVQHRAGETDQDHGEKRVDE